MTTPKRILPIPDDIIRDLANVSIRRAHRLGLKHGILPATTTEFLFRKIWRGKRVTAKELTQFHELRQLVLESKCEHNSAEA